MHSDSIEQRVRFSQEKVDLIRKELHKTLGPSAPFCVVSSGSYSRREASEQSDIDFFIVCDSHKSKDAANRTKESLAKVISKIVGKPPSKGGVFDQPPESIQDMEKNIGGQNDTNDKLTRRILFLLEGDWLYGRGKFDEFRSRIVSRYVQRGITDHQISRFFLNDLIRYYRTVCVDFEYKTFEAGKDWGTRNLKLIFPRKLLYFSGILVAAESAQSSYNVKVDSTIALLALTPIQRVARVCGARSARALEMYAKFLSEFSKPEVRKIIAKVRKDRDTHAQSFKDLKNTGHHFSWELSKLLRETYDSGHPIHSALVL